MDDHSFHRSRRARRRGWAVALLLASGLALGLGLQLWRSGPRARAGAAVTAGIEAVEAASAPDVPLQSPDPERREVAAPPPAAVMTTPPVDEPATQQGAVALRGRVVDEQGRLFPAFEYSEPVRRDDGHGITIAEEWKSAAQGAEGFELAFPTLGGARLDFLVRVAGYAQGFKSVPLMFRTSIDLGDIVLTRGGVCSGLVVDAAGRPLGGASIEPRFSGPARAERVETRGDGGFDFAFDPAATLLSLFVQAEDHAPRWLEAGHVGDRWEGITIVMTQGARIAGSVLKDGRASVGETVKVWLHSAGDVVAGGERGSSPWSRTAFTALDGTYGFDGVPLGRIGIGISQGGEKPPDGVRRVALLDVPAPGAYSHDFRLGDGLTIRGSIEMPMPATNLFLELFARGDDGELRAVAGLGARGGRPGSPDAFVFEDVEGGDEGAPLVLRISFAPGLYADRTFHPSGHDVDLGTYRFPTLESLVEFERPGRQLFVR